MKLKTVFFITATVFVALSTGIALKSKTPAKAETSSSISYSKEYLASIEEKVLGVDTKQERPSIEGLACMERSKYVIDVSDEDIDLMVRVVMSEGSILSIEGKQAIAETIINRVLADEFPNTVSEVVYMENAYSVADNGEPTTECIDAVITALEYHAFPESLLYFRTDRYHDFAYPYMKVGNTYFSTTENLITIYQ